MKTKETMTICLANYTSLTRIHTSFTVIDKIGRAVWPKTHELRDKSCRSSGSLISDSGFHRMWRLINAFAKVRQEILKKKMLEKYVRSRNVYENKQN